MSDDPKVPNDSVTRAQRIDQVCDAFESEWVSGQQPRLEDALTQAGPVEQDQLLHELLPIEIFHRAKRGEQPSPADYVARFKALDPAWVEKVIAEQRLRQPPPAHNKPPATSDAPTMAFAGPVRSSPPIIRYFGDYELQEEIARGGMGVVYKARQVKLNRIVAVKMILSGQLASSADVERFYTEAKAAAQLDHPGIVPIYEVGQHQGQHYFSMGLVEGPSLASRVTEGPLPVREAAEIVRAVAEAVQYAHDKGVIHRDLKPSNILIDLGGKPRVTDFGLAKLTESGSDLTGTGQVLGTPSFMPPEQAAAQVSAVGRESDVYSLGAVLYCLLTGRPPFQAATAVETLLQVQKQEPLSPRQLNDAIPLDLDTIILKCLDKSPSRRYRSARDLSEEFTRYLTGRPILARRVSRPERLWRWCRRNPFVASLLATAALLLIVIAGVSTAAYLREASLRGELEIKSNQLTIKTDQLADSLATETKLKEEADALRIEETKLMHEAKKQAEIEKHLRTQTEQQNLNLNALRLTAEGQRTYDESPQLGLLLVSEAIQQNLRAGEPVLPQTEQSLREMLDRFAPVPFERTADQGSQPTQVSADGCWMLSTAEGHPFLWDRQQFSPWYLPLKLPVAEPADAWEFTRDSRWLIGAGGKEIQLISLLDPLRPVVQVPQIRGLWKLKDSGVVSASGRYIAIAQRGSGDATGPTRWIVIDTHQPIPFKGTGQLGRSIAEISFNADETALIVVSKAATGLAVDRAWLDEGPHLQLKPWLVPAATSHSYRNKALVSRDGRWLVWEDEVATFGRSYLFDLNRRDGLQVRSPEDETHLQELDRPGKTTSQADRLERAKLARTLPTTIYGFSADSRYLFSQEGWYDLSDSAPKLDAKATQQARNRAARTDFLKDVDDVLETWLSPDEHKFVAIFTNGLVRAWESPQVTTKNLVFEGTGRGRASPSREIIDALDRKPLLAVSSDGRWLLSRGRTIQDERQSWERRGTAAPAERHQLWQVGDPLQWLNASRQDVRGESDNRAIALGPVIMTPGQTPVHLLRSENDRWLVRPAQDGFFVWDQDQRVADAAPAFYRDLLHAHEPTRRAVFGKNCWFVIAILRYGEVALYRLGDRAHEWTARTLDWPRAFIRSLAISPDERTLAIACQGNQPRLGKIVLCELPSGDGSAVHRTSLELDDVITTIAISPSNRQLIAITQHIDEQPDGKLQKTYGLAIWDLENPEVPARRQHITKAAGFEGFTPTLQFSPDSIWIAASLPGAIVLVDARSIHQEAWSVLNLEIQAKTLTTSWAAGSRQTAVSSLIARRTTSLPPSI